MAEKAPWQLQATTGLNEPSGPADAGGLFDAEISEAIFPFSGRGWYVQLGKEQIKLADGPKNTDTEDAALKRYHEVMAERGRTVFKLEMQKCHVRLLVMASSS